VTEARSEHAQGTTDDHGCRRRRLGPRPGASACSAPPPRRSSSRSRARSPASCWEPTDLEDATIEVHAAGEHDADALDELRLLLDGEDVTDEATRDDGVLTFWPSTTSRTVPGPSRS
jgi:hypothetical protein